MKLLRFGITCLLFLIVLTSFVVKAEAVDDAHITSCSQLNTDIRNIISTNVGTSFNLILDNDIDCQGINFEPLDMFSGDFDGGGHTISNLSIGNTTLDNQGLFFSLGDVKIHNLNISGANIKGTSQVGALSGNFAGGTIIIDQVSVDATSTIIGSGSDIGAFVGSISIDYYDPTFFVNITNSSSSASVSGKYSVGGLAGSIYLNSSLTITNSSNLGNVSGEYYVGGLAGEITQSESSSAEIINSFNNGNISANYDGDSNNSAYSIGGLIGLITVPDSKITNCHNSGTITATGKLTVGGLVGFGSKVNISQSYNEGTINATLINVSNAGRSNAIGGIVGIGILSSINNSYNKGDINGNLRVGGLEGISLSTQINSSYNKGTITVPTGTIASGLVAQDIYLNGYGVNTASLTMSNSFSTGEIIRGNGTVGAIVGSMDNQEDKRQYDFEDNWWSSSLDNGIGNDNGLNLGDQVAGEFEKIVSKTVNPNPSTIQADVVKGFISTGTTNPSNTNDFTFNLDYTMDIGNSTTVTFPADTVATKTGGGNLDLTTFITTDSTLEVKNELNDSISAIKVGIPDINLNFSKEITINIPVGNDYNGQTLSIYYQTEGDTNWNSETTCTVTNGICSFQTNHATTFAVKANAQTTNNNTSSSNNNSNSSSVCTDSKPLSISDLFEIRTTKNSAKLFFTPLSDTNKYFISFSEEPNAEKHGEQVTLLREGVQSHNIYYLKPNTTYYVKVRGQNGCMPGDWSNIMKFKTNSINQTKAKPYYKYINFLKNIISPFQKF